MVNGFTTDAEDDVQIDLHCDVGPEGSQRKRGFTISLCLNVLFQNQIRDSDMLLLKKFKNQIRDSDMLLLKIKKRKALMYRHDQQCCCCLELPAGVEHLNSILRFPKIGLDLSPFPRAFGKDL